MVDFLKDQHLETEMNHYWTERSKSYSEQNRAQIENEKRHEWENMILKYAPQKECLNILDVGTGPGFFAIILAQKGHHVTAVDLTQDMLEQEGKPLNLANLNEIVSRRMEDKIERSIFLLDKNKKIIKGRL